MRIIQILAGFFMIFLGLTNCQKKNQHILKIYLDKNKPVTPIKYGWHYEEIGMIGDGGLYAEMVRNRGLEEANPPKGLKVIDGYYAGVPNPTQETKQVYKIDPLEGWCKFPADNPDITISRADKRPMNEQNPHSLEITAKSFTNGRTITGTVVNIGYYGMNYEEGRRYKLSFYLRAEQFTGPFEIWLGDSTGKKISDVFQVQDISAKWKKYSLSLLAMNNTRQGRLFFHPCSAGTIWLDMVSMFPGNTWDHGKSVFRADIMQNLVDYKPEFIRFPGGCIVHGVNTETMYHWKETIGDIAERPGAWSKWKPNYRTDGLGYHEFYQLCEYLKADAMYVTPSGLVCSQWVFQDGESDRYFQPDTDVKQYIRDALDAIEYAIGPTDTQWGAKRAANGHPEPFPLKYIEIGNEDFGPEYYKNYDALYRAIKGKYPGLKIIANSIIGQSPDRDRKRERITDFKDPSTIEIFDEHYYKDIPWIINNYYKFDKYNRAGPDLFIGEMGIRGDYPSDMLGEAIFLMNMERNADLNPMMADRPLMRNWRFVEGKSNPLYFHTNSTSFKTINYYMSKLFRDNKIDTYYESEYWVGGKNAGISEQYMFSSAGKDPVSGDLIIKVVNLTEKQQKVLVDIGNVLAGLFTTITILSAKNNQINTPLETNAVSPKIIERKLDFPLTHMFEPQSLTVFKVKLQ